MFHLLLDHKLCTRPGPRFPLSDLVVGWRGLIRHRVRLLPVCHAVLHVSITIPGTDRLASLHVVPRASLVLREPVNLLVTFFAFETATWPAAAPDRCCHDQDHSDDDARDSTGLGSGFEPVETSGAIVCVVILSSKQAMGSIASPNVLSVWLLLGC